jgi:hypothetical protein
MMICLYISLPESDGVLCVLVDDVEFLCIIRMHWCCVLGMCICFFLPGALLILYSDGLWVCDDLFPMSSCDPFILMVLSEILIVLYCWVYSYIVGWMSEY